MIVLTNESPNAGTVLLIPEKECSLRPSPLEGATVVPVLIPLDEHSKYFSTVS